MKPSVLVTGASAGIGAATALLLADRGFRVFGTSRSPERAAPEAPHAEWIAMDVCDDNAVERGVAEAVSLAGRLDALVCNAGYGIFGSGEEVSLEQARAQLDTNFFGVLRTLRAALPSMREARTGRIVLVGSLAGRAPIPFQAHYSASKAAVQALALALRNELHSFGSGVSLVEPGDIRTGFNEAMEWSDSRTSAYADQAGRTEQVIRESHPDAPGPEVVARTIHRALTARHPRVRYSVGTESTLVAVGSRLFPDWFSLALIRNHFRI